MENPLGLPFAAARTCAAVDLTGEASHPALAAAWRRSAKQLRAIGEALSAANVDPSVACVVVSGSLGRMEEVAGSDCDLFVVVGSGDDEQRRRRAVESVWEALAELCLERPDPKGVFALAAGIAELCDKQHRGRVDESPATFGKRFQLLLDCQPVFGFAEYERLLAGVLERYIDPNVGAAAPAWSHLLDDLLRYHRSLRVNYLWDFVEDGGKWRSQNLKGAFSRLVMFAALVTLLGEGTCQTNADDAGALAAWLSPRLRLTPLERLDLAYRAAEDGGFAIVAGEYEAFLASMQDSAFRRELAIDDARGHVSPPGSPARAAGHAAYQEMATRGERLRAELTRFIAARGRAWDGRFASRLML